MLAAVCGAAERGAAVRGAAEGRIVSSSLQGFCHLRFSLGPKETKGNLENSLKSYWEKF